MQEETGNHIPITTKFFVPDIYMPRLQLFIRCLLGAMAGVYFYFSPIPPLILSTTQILDVLVVYYAFHFFGWWYYKSYGAKDILFRLGSWMDIITATAAVLVDPSLIPPMLLLFLMAVLGNGIQYKVNILIESIIVALIFGVSALVVHYILLWNWPPYSMYFYVFLVIVGAYYSYFLVRRIETMKMEAISISEYDSLTGLLSRRSFEAIAEYMLLLNERTFIPLVFIFADLDSFKAVNDQFGHHTGDKVLGQFSNMARSKFRKTDIISRYGGDEFVILLTNTSLTSAESVMQKLQGDFRNWARNNGFPVGVSYGMRMVQEGKNNLGDILRQVDSALYDAKPKNGNVK